MSIFFPPGNKINKLDLKYVSQFIILSPQEKVCVLSFWTGNVYICLYTHTASKHPSEEERQRHNKEVSSGYVSKTASFSAAGIKTVRGSTFWPHKTKEKHLW